MSAYSSEISSAAMFSETHDNVSVNPTEIASVSDVNSTVANGTEDYYSYDKYYYDEDEYYTLEVFPFEVVTLGIVRPILVLITAVANFFVVGFFMTKKNRGRPTNLLFVSIAFSDTMTGLLLLPNSFYVYLGKNNDLSRDWCNTYMILRLYLSRVFHTVSVWQTVMLGIQRYMCVCHPFISGRVCTLGKTFVSIVIMYCMAIVLHVYHMLEDKVIEANRGCAWVPETPCTGMCVYLWFCVVLQHTLPCLLLICLTIKTLTELRKANKRVSSMSQKFGNKRSSRDRIITITTSLVVIVFLVPELPHGIYKLVLAVDGLNIKKSTESNHIIICVYELALLVSFHANFWIYCTMMHDFRHAILKCVTCGIFKRGLARVRTFSGSLSPRKNSVNTNVSRTSSLVSRNRILSQTTSIHSTASDTIHAVLPLSPTRSEYGRVHGFQRVNSVDEQNDDVFV